MGKEKYKIKSKFIQLFRVSKGYSKKMQSKGKKKTRKKKDLKHPSVSDRSSVITYIYTASLALVSKKLNTTNLKF